MCSSLSVFDPNEKSDGQNPEYVKVHDEYKNLVKEKTGPMKSMKYFENKFFEGRLYVGYFYGRNANYTRAI